MRAPSKVLLYVIVFALAMGFMESAIVIYLRELFYPEGFKFPLVPIPHKLAVVEILREGATVIMLVCIGFLAGINKVQRFAYFNLAFAVWDLAYYLFLYVFLGWPVSLLSWDILFLIPVPWVGPVWAPCLLSIVMVIGSVFMIQQTGHKHSYQIRKAEWILVILGAILCIISFMTDFFRSTNSAISNSVISSDDLFTEIKTYIPQKFDIQIFLLGLCIIIGTILSNIFLTNKRRTLIN